MNLDKEIMLGSYGYLRVAAVVPAVNVADVKDNTRYIKDAIDQSVQAGASVVVLPELCITGYTCADLFLDRMLLKKSYDALAEIVAHTAGYPGVLVAVGMPVIKDGDLYNCAVMVSSGEILGVVPKSYLPNYGEFYEQRWFASGIGVNGQVKLLERMLPMGIDLLFDLQGVKIGVELCEDLWAPNPPSTRACLAGAEIILNLSASNEVIGKHDYLVNLISQQSARLHAGYVYASAGHGESSTDVVFAGNGIVAESGALLATTPRFTGEPQMAMADIDLALLRHDRRRSSTWRDAVAADRQEFRRIEVPAGAQRAVKQLCRRVDPAPFVPAEDSRRAERCREIISIQAAGLMRRLQATRCRTLVVGISGGLDSTLALLVAHQAFVNLGLDPKGIIGITMPGFGTTGRTYNNATELVKCLGATLEEISIAKSVRQHFEDIGHDEALHDVTYENCQARERTQILMDFANKAGGMVLGTGDLSELALGWCTYNGDHMSMYGVNASVPKTLVKHLVQYFADMTADENLRRVLTDIIDTPISPELLPVTASGDIDQKTEDLVGPYRLHDFVLYNLLRYGFEPGKIYMLACAAFRDEYSPDVIKHWLKVFYRRFFNQQFKRSCMPDGPKVGSVCLSPRGDWRMPSDASARLWLEECEEL